MQPENEWTPRRGDTGDRLGMLGLSAVRMALIFGSAAVALALILAPIADRQTRNYYAQSNGLDTMSTGSIGSGSRYTIRQSVLQPSPSSICVIQANGRRSGEC
jgi:hypothetical protein